MRGRTWFHENATHEEKKAVIFRHLQKRKEKEKDENMLRSRGPASPGSLETANRGESRKDQCPLHQSVQGYSSSSKKARAFHREKPLRDPATPARTRVEPRENELIGSAIFRSSACSAPSVNKLRRRHRSRETRPLFAV